MTDEHIWLRVCLFLPESSCIFKSQKQSTPSCLFHHPVPNYCSIAEGKKGERESAGVKQHRAWWGLQAPCCVWAGPAGPSLRICASSRELQASLLLPPLLHASSASPAVTAVFPGMSVSAVGATSGRGSRSHCCPAGSLPGA